MSDDASSTRSVLHWYLISYGIFRPLRGLVKKHYQPIPEEIRNRGEDRKSLELHPPRFPRLVLGFETPKDRSMCLFCCFVSAIAQPSCRHPSCKHRNRVPASPTRAPKPDHGTITGHQVHMAAQRRGRARNLASRFRHRQRRSPPSLQKFHPSSLTPKLLHGISILPTLHWYCDKGLSHNLPLHQRNRPPFSLPLPRHLHRRPRPLL